MSSSWVLFQPEADIGFLMIHKFSAYTRSSLKLIIKPEEHVKHFQRINFHDLQNQSIKDLKDGILLCKKTNGAGVFPEIVRRPISEKESF